MSWELMSYGELMSGGTNVLDSIIRGDGEMANRKELLGELTVTRES